MCECCVGHARAGTHLFLSGRKGHDFMKLIITIVSNKDVERVLENLSKSGFRSTKISTMGQFLQDGHTSLLIGVEDAKVDEVFDVIQSSVSKRIVKQHGVQSTLKGTLLKQPVDVEEFGGVAFVINVEEFKKF